MTTWNICTHPDNPVILLPEGDLIPNGYNIEGQTSNPNYLTDSNSTISIRHVTVKAFRGRFTQTEKITLDLASIDDPTAPMERRQLAAALRVNTKDSDSATFIDLDDEQTRMGVMALEQYGLIAKGRSLEILNAPVQDFELP